MIRTQVRLREEQYTALQRRAARQKRSLAELIRESMDWWLARGPSTKALHGLKELSGAFRDPARANKVAEHHDRYLSEPEDPGVADRVGRGA